MTVIRRTSNKQQAKQLCKELSRRQREASWISVETECPFPGTFVIVVAFIAISGFDHGVLAGSE